MKALICFLCIFNSILVCQSPLKNLDSLGGKELDGSYNARYASERTPVELPEIKASDDIIRHTAYVLSYNEDHEQANWVAYELTKEETMGKLKRSDKFIPDPLVSTQSANNADYAGKGYDRGHLAPAADMSWSKITLDESFYYSNISPQVPSFNRGIWKKLEEQVRDWAREYQKLYITTGPVLTPQLKRIGRNKVSVPQYYYKVILRPDNQAIAFVVPNKKSTMPLEFFAVTVDSVESLTGIDFFPSLPDETEEIVESKIKLLYWNIGKALTKKE